MVQRHLKVQLCLYSQMEMVVYLSRKGKWKEVLKSKYGAELECPNISVKHQSWWWRDLVKVCSEGGGDGWFHEEVRWKLGRGDKVRFWEDVWIGDSSLKSSFQRIFSLSTKGSKM